jgi:hypothetical protein
METVADSDSEARPGVREHSRKGPVGKPIGDFVTGTQEGQMKILYRAWTRYALAVSLLVASPGIAATAEKDGDKDTEAPPHHEAASEPIAGKKAIQESEPKGVFDTPVKIGGTGITLKFGGFAKVDFIQDFDPIGNPDKFQTNSIPVEGDPDAGLGGSNNISARQTRFSVDGRGDTSTGMVRVYIEGDFFGDSNAFRLRHGYGEWKGVLGGQTWTTFQDIKARPFTLDYEGPDTEIFVRQPMIRYTGTPRDAVEWSVAVEDPSSQISVTDTTIVGGGLVTNSPMSPHG